MTHKLAFLATCLASVAGCAASIYYVGHANSLPFTPQITSADTALVRPIPGVPLPEGLEAGDEIDLPALDQAARAVLVVGGQANANLRLGDSYTLQIRDGATDRAVAVTTVVVGQATPQRKFIGWVFVYTPILLALMGIISGWRGIGRAASLFSLWCACVLFPLSLLELPLAPGALLSAYFISFVGVFLGRVTMYLLAETVAGDVLSPRERTWLRAVFTLTLALGILVQFAGETVFLIQGSATWILPGLRWLVAFPHLISAIVLALAMTRTQGADRIRITWMAWSVLFVFLGTLVRDVGIFDAVVTLGADVGFVSLGVIGMLYAILRHRVIDMSVVVDRTLVYGATTSLVVGVLAAVNSLALRATLGVGASLLLQVVVPLALGIVLGKVRVYMDMIVERVFFRSRYLSEQALRAFGRHAGHFDDVQELLAAAVANLARHTGSPGIAMYEPSKEGYTSMRATGDAKFPKKLRTDDPAMVAVRAEMRPLEVADPDSALSHEAVVFPITVLGRLRGVVVCANRPGEHFSSDEQKLIAEVVREVGAAWRILRASDNEALVFALADGDIKPAAAQRRARLLAYGARPARA